MRRIVIASCIAILGTLVFASSAFAWQPPGLRGYEGQPGHQGGGSHHP